MITRRLCPLLLCASLSGAASYHVAADGDDSRTSAQAGNAATPWKTLAKLGTISLQPGDSILLRKGDVWRESLVLKQSGTASAPIVVTGYGNATALPELRGTVTLQGISSAGIWSATVSAGTSVGSVFASDVPLPVSRFPDTGWVFASSVAGNSGLTASELAAKDWTGASIHLRTAMWTLETNRIGTQTGSQLTFAKSSLYNPPAKVGFFLTNHASALGTATAWAFSASTSTLRWTGSTGAVEASVLPTLADLRGSNHVRIEGLRLFGATTQAILADGDGIEVRASEILYPGMYGIYMGSGREAKVTGTRIVGAANDGIFLNGAAPSVQGSTILRTAVQPFLTPEGMGDGCCGGYGVLLQGDSAILSGNRVDSTGYNGLGFMGRSSLVQENVVGHSCMVTDDCAGIYTITGFSGSAFKTGAMGSVVRRNIVRDVVGSLGGWADAVASSQGIYLDDGSHDIRVDSNVVSNATNGLYLHNGQRDTIRGNLFYGNRISPVLLTHDALAGTSDMKDNLFTGNLMVGLVGQGAHSDASILQAQSLPLATFRDNTSCFDHRLHAECRHNESLLWERFGYDTAKAGFGPETAGSASFDTTVWGWGAYPWQTEYVRDSGAACAKGKGCMKIGTSKVTEANAMVYGGVVAVQKGQLYRLAFRAKGSRPGQRMTPTLRHARSSWSAMGYASGLMLDTAWNRYELYMRADATEDTARVDYTTRSLDSTWWLDDVSFRSVPEAMHQSLDSSSLATNGSASTISLVPNTTPRMDAWGASLNSGFTIAPFQGVVAFPYQGWLATGLSTKATTSLLASRNGRTWLLQGLTSPASIVDARGRLLAHLKPDAAGKTAWTAPMGIHLCFLKTNGHSQPLVTP